MNPIGPLMQFARAPLAICSSIRLLILSLAPAGIGLLLFLLLSLLGVTHATDFIDYFLVDLSGWLYWLSLPFVIAATLLLAAVSAWIGMLVIGAWFFELIVEHALRSEGRNPITNDDGWLQSAFQMLKDEGAKLLLVVALTLLALFLSFIPPVSALALLASAYLVGLELLDVPLAALGYRFEQRKQILAPRRVEILLFGGLMMLGLMIPFAVLFFPQIAHVASARAVAGWELEGVGNDQIFES